MKKPKQEEVEAKNRIQFSEFNVVITGHDGSHTVLYNEGQWSCSCDFFVTRGVCSHTMTVERALEGMLRPEWMTEVKGETLEETHTKYQVHKASVPEEADESSSESRLDQMSIELRRLSNQVVEMRTQLASMVLQTRVEVHSDDAEDKPREITFREFLGAIWW